MEKNGETRRETKNQWGDEMQDKKNGVTRQRQKKWGDKTQDQKKNGQTRQETTSSPKASNGQRFPCPA